MQSPGHERGPDASGVPGGAPDRLRERLADGTAVVAGVLSGTSADGIDVALVRFEPGDRPPGRPHLLAFETLSFPRRLRRRVRDALDGRRAGELALGDVARLDRDLGLAFGAAARATAEAHALELDLVASHGQTVWHHDGTEGGAATLQLGDGCRVAAVAGCPAASDFRQADVAAGGEGAPLSALADDLLFADAPRPLAILNLGGLSNLTLLPEEGGGGPVLAFDTGPCGSLLDGLARRLLGCDLDRDGEAAARGRVRADLLEACGRDTFGEAWIDGLVAAAGDAPADDLLRTAVETVAACVALGLERFVPAESRGEELVVCGGGLHHPVLRAALRERTGLPVASSADHGVDPDAREALVFAVLGARCALGVPSVLRAPGGERGPTGARAGGVPGKLSHA
jgi:anhydro-N-acetylmuramic acid kinase